MQEITDEDVLAKYPRFAIDHDNKAHWKGFLQRKLLINRCQDCGHWIYPNRPMCPKCWSERVVPTEVSGKGTVYTLFFMYQGPPIPGFDYSTPYPVVAVELPEQKGLRIASTIVNCRKEDMYIGMPVEVTWMERGGAPVPAFQPAPGAVAKR
jgi:uncharacterized OB-fold protein